MAPKTHPETPLNTRPYRRAYRQVRHLSLSNTVVLSSHCKGKPETNAKAHNYSCMEFVCGQLQPQQSGML